MFATLLAALATSSGLTMVKRSVDDNSSTTETNTTEVNTTLSESGCGGLWSRGQLTLSEIIKIERFVLTVLLANKTIGNI